VPAESPQRLLLKPARDPTVRFGSLIVAMLLLAATGALGLITVERMQASRELVLHTYRVRGLLKDLRADIGESHANFDLYQLSRNPNEARDLEEQSDNQLRAFRELQKLSRDNLAQQARLEQFRELLQQDIDQLRECVAHANCLGTSSSSKSDQMAVIFARRRTMSDMLRNIENIEAQVLESRLAMLDRLFLRLVIILVGSFLLALILLGYNIKLLIKEIDRRKELERIEKKNAESYRMLSGRILELQDVERRKIARELHDSVGQFLAGLKLNLSRLQRREAEPTQQNRSLLMEAIDLTERAITEVRTISHLLHPPLLDELGFHSAARWYTEGFAKRSGIQAELKVVEIAERLPREVELALFRVLQESLTNVHRHAKASRVEIEVKRVEDEVILGVLDNGKGISRNVLEKFRAGQAGGIGLAGMRERLAELGGRLELESGPNGTQVRAILPAHHQQEELQTPAGENLTISQL
jgi:signal transduction histidine kinase